MPLDSTSALLSPLTPAVPQLRHDLPSKLSLSIVLSPTVGPEGVHTRHRVVLFSVHKVCYSVNNTSIKIWSLIHSFGNMFRF